MGYQVTRPEGANPTFCGNGGELFRGYCYPQAAKSIIDNYKGIDIEKKLIQKFYRLDRFKWLTPEIKDGVLFRISDAIKQLYEMRTHPRDVLDLFSHV